MAAVPAQAGVRRPPDLAQVLVFLPVAGGTRARDRPQVGHQLESGNRPVAAAQRPSGPPGRNATGGKGSSCRRCHSTQDLIDNSGNRLCIERAAGLVPGFDQRPRLAPSALPGTNLGRQVLRPLLLPPRAVSGIIE